VAEVEEDVQVLLLTQCLLLLFLFMAGFWVLARCGYGRAQLFQGSCICHVSYEERLDGFSLWGYIMYCVTLDYEISNEL
jgi:uncharacterized membrane protein